MSQEYATVSSSASLKKNGINKLGGRRPLVSVIIPMYNASHYIAEALISVLGQTYDCWEIIAINDGSTDNTEDVVKEFFSIPGFCYLSQTNSGVSAARNAGLRQAQGEMIAFIDHDDKWLPDKLERQVAHLLANPQDGMVHGNILFMDADGRPLPRSISDFKTDLSGWCFKELFADNRIATLTVCVRRECVEQVGFFREDIRGGEDYEYWLRVAMLFKIARIDDDLAVYRLHDSNATKNWLPQLIDLSKALEGLIDQFPEARRKLGRRAIKDRLLPIHVRIADELCRIGNYEDAKPHLLRTLALQPLHFHSLNLLAVGLTPARIRTAVRWYWNKLFG